MLAVAVAGLDAACSRLAVIERSVTRMRRCASNRSSYRRRSIYLARRRPRPCPVMRIYTRRSADCTKRFPQIVDTVQKLNVQSILLDGEGIITDNSGLAIFDLVHSKANDDAMRLCAFDLLELDGDDVRARPAQ